MKVTPSVAVKNKFSYVIFGPEISLQLIFLFQLTVIPVYQIIKLCIFAVSFETVFQFASNCSQAFFFAAIKVGGND